MAHRWIEILIGRILTDEQFRVSFERDPRAVLEEMSERGTQLTAGEVAALISIDPLLWRSVAEQIDPRLQKASLKNSQS